MAKANDVVIDENEEIKDFSKPLTLEDVQREFKRLQDLQSTNVVRVAGKIIDKRVSDGGQMFVRDAKGNYTEEPVLDAEGNPRFWDAKHYITLAFEGGELVIPVKNDAYEELQLDMRVLFNGRKKSTKNNGVIDSFDGYTVLM